MQAMHVLALSLIALVALEHLYFMYLEMFAWTQTRTRRAFGTTAEFAEASKSLAANQGLYNGFLAAGLVWSLLHPDPLIARQLQLFFLGCVLIAAIYGGITVKRSILLIQGLPAALALAVVFLR
jgi:putative membrane protein